MTGEKEIIRKILRAKYTDGFGMFVPTIKYIDEKTRLEWDMQLDSRFLTRMGDEKHALKDYVKRILDK